MNSGLLKGTIFVVSLALECLAHVAAPARKPPNRAMALIRGGTIQVGIDAADIPRLEKVFDIDRMPVFQDERPRHLVTVDDFYIDRYLVTNQQFQSFTDAKPE